MHCVVKLSLTTGKAAPVPVGEFKVVYADEGGEHRVDLIDAWRVPLESGSPVRGFPSYKGQRHHSGRWWTATTETLIGYESWLERDWLLLLDFDPNVVGIAAQPFWLCWTTPEGQPRSHAPDYFARMLDGSALVLDCRPPERIKDRDQLAFQATRSACARLGWRYEVAGPPSATSLTNAHWLSGYRHPRHYQRDIAAALKDVFEAPTGLFEGAAAIGDPTAVLPTLYHLLWRHELNVDVTEPLHINSTVTLGTVTA
jgi:hypothetical protein